MSVTGHDSLKARRTLKVGSKSYDYFSLEAAAAAAGLGDVARLRGLAGAMHVAPDVVEATYRAMIAAFTEEERRSVAAGAGEMAPQ